MPSLEPGYSLKLDREYGVLLRNRAEIERRTVKQIVQEAIRQYEEAQQLRKAKHDAERTQLLSPPGSGLNGLLADMRRQEP